MHGGVGAIYDEWPRLVGNPYTRVAHNRAEFDAFVAENTGKFPCFTSHNSLPNMDEVLVRYVPFDFDAEDKLENALADVLALDAWANDHKLWLLVTFTGGRGFHAYLTFKPLLCANNGALKKVYRALQLTAHSEAKLRTTDKMVFGQPARLMRIVGSRHQNTQRYCVEIPRAMLARADIHEIVSYSAEPRAHIEAPTPRETLAETVARLRPNLHIEHRVALETATVPYMPPTDIFIKAILPRPCIHTEIMTHNPKHLARVEACSNLVKLGFDYEWICQFFDDVAKQAGWVDRNPGITAYHVQQIMGKGGYEPRSCSNIRADGYCVGESCPIFKYAFKEERQ